MLRTGKTSSYIIPGSHRYTNSWVSLTGSSKINAKGCRRQCKATKRHALPGTICMCVSFTCNRAAWWTHAKRYRHDEIATRLISSTCICLLFSQALCRDSFQFWDSFLLFIHQPPLWIVQGIQFSASLVSNWQSVSVPFVRFLHVWSFSVSSQTLDRTWLNTKTEYVLRSHCRLFSTLLAVYLCFCIPEILLSDSTRSVSSIVRRKCRRYCSVQQQWLLMIWFPMLVHSKKRKL